MEAEQELWRRARQQLAAQELRWSELQLVLNTETATLQALHAETTKLRKEREADGQRAAQVKAAAVRAALHVEQLKLRVRTEDGETRTLLECMELLKSRKSALAVESCAARSQFQRRLESMSAQLSRFKEQVHKVSSSQP